MDDLLGSWLFSNLRGTGHILKCVVDDYFKAAVEHIGSFDGDHQPVPHSLRRSFTVHIMDEWVRSGGNLNELMPYLGNQLGHKNLSDTMYYYHMLFESYETIQKNTRDVYLEVNYDEERKDR